MSHSKTGSRLGIKAILLSIALFAAAGTLFVAGSRSSRGANAAASNPASRPTPLSLPLYFEPNQGQTDARVKFLARGAGYGLFLTADEAVLSLQHAPNAKASAGSSPDQSFANVIRMRLDGANSAPRVHGTEPLPGKSSYFLGNDRSKWRIGIPQFARVEYQSVYPGINLVYYGNDRQLEYDFHIAPGSNPDQIALNFTGASARLDSGDLVLSTTTGNVRFHAPHVYQSGDARAISGSFRQLADNKIGFSIGAYDHSRELVIDPVLSYSTFIGGTGAESLVKVAVDSSDLVYLAGTTTSTDFPTVGAIQGAKGTNLFIAKLNPALAGTAQLLFATYLGGSGTDQLAGIAVDPNNGLPNIYVAGTTSSPDFPTSSSAFQMTPFSAGTHGFLSKLNPSSGAYVLGYSTYLSGNGIDRVTGLAIDNLQNAYLTGSTTSTNDQSNYFPANPNGYQRLSNAAPGIAQFFASRVNTTGTGTQSMIYSTYFGGGNFGGNPNTVVQGGGIAVDPSGNLYFTGATNMLPVTGANGEIALQLFNAYQTCLNNNCSTPDATYTDAILVKLNPSPTQPQAAPLLATYLGGNLSDSGIAVAVDSSSNAYVTGETDSPTTAATDWNCVPPSCILGTQSANAGAGDAFIAKIGNQVQSGTIFPLNFFTFIGGSGFDTGQAILVDSVGTAHVAGTTSSSNLTVANPLQSPPYNGGVYGGGPSDAFVALIATGSITTGNYLTYLGGDQTDAGTGIALDLNNTAYVAGTTNSANFPTQNAYNAALNGSDGGAPDAFVAKLGASSVITVTAPASSPNPNPVPAGTPALFTFDINNTSGDPASNVQFQAIVPTSGIASVPTATANSGGTCSAAVGAIILCDLGSLAVNATASVQVSVTPSIPINPLNPQISVSGAASANGGALGAFLGQQDGIVDFVINASGSGQTVKAGDLASFPITLTPITTYNATITMSQSSSPTIVTATTPTFTNPTVILSGNSGGTTTLNIQTVARPVTTGSLFHRTSFYAAWLPIGGLSLIGLGIGAGTKRRRWLTGAILGLILGIIFLLPSCSSSSTPVSTPGGTAAGQYTITITGSAGGSAAHNIIVTLNVT